MGIRAVKTTVVPMALKIIQINLNRCRPAQDMIEHNVSQLNMDVVIISEPFRQLNYWFTDATGDLYGSQDLMVTSSRWHV